MFYGARIAILVLSLTPMLPVHPAYGQMTHDQRERLFADAPGAMAVSARVRELEERGQVDEAVLLLTQSVAKDPGQGGMFTGVPGVGLGLHQLIGLLIGKGDLGVAWPLCEQAVRASRALESTTMMSSVNVACLAEVEKANGNLAKAKELLQRGLDVWEREQGPQGSNTVYYRARIDSLDDPSQLRHSSPIRRLSEREMALRVAVAEAYVRSGAAGALTPVASLVEEVRTVYGPKSAELASAENMQAALQFSAGDTTAAREASARALRISETASGPDGLGLAHSLRSSARIAELSGESAAAAAAWRARAEELTANSERGQRSAKVRKKSDDLDALEREVSQLESRGRAPDAVSLLERELARSPERNPEDTARLLGRLATSYQFSKDIPKAIATLQREIEILERAELTGFTFLFQPTWQLGGLQEMTGDYEQAEIAYGRELALYNASDFGRVVMPAAASPAVALARVRVAMGKPVDAAREIQRDLPRPSAGDVLSALAIAEAQELAGDASAAERTLAEGLARIDSAEESRFVSPDEHARLLTSLARIQAARGETAEARRGLEKSEKVGAKMEGPGFTADEFLERAAVYARLNDPEAAMRQWIAGIDKSSEEYEGPWKAFNESGRKMIRDGFLVDQLDGAVSLHLIAAPRAAAVARGAASAVLARKGIVLDAEVLSRRSASSTVDGIRAMPRADALREVEAALPSGAALVEIVSFTRFDVADFRRGMLSRPSREDRRYAAYVIAAGKAPTAVELGPATEIEQAVQELRFALADPVSNRFRPAARRMDALVMQPVRGILGSRTRVLIAPDGALNLVPFESLVDESGRYLDERFRFTYLDSGRDLLRAPRQTRDASPPLVVADPDFDAGAATGKSSRSFSPLPGAASEAESIQRSFPSAAKLSGGAATETAVKQVHGPLVLHFATHGFFLERPREDGKGPSAGEHDRDGVSRRSQPGEVLERAGIALAGANRGGSGDDDGVLTARELASVDLQGTEMVVVSSCESGLGDPTYGDGIYGLHRALSVAGAQSVVLSLWAVDDRSTAQLMEKFYEGLARGESRSDALHAARAFVRAAHDHPYHWASFVLSGDWQPLSISAR